MYGTSVVYTRGWGGAMKILTTFKNRLQKYHTELQTHAVNGEFADKHTLDTLAQQIGEIEASLSIWGKAGSIEPVDNACMTLIFCRD